MEIIQLKTCCGIFSLRTGSLIILWINLIVGLFLALYPAVSHFSHSHQKNANEIIHPPTPYTPHHSHKKTTPSPPPEEDLGELSKEFNLNYRAIDAFHTWSPPTGWIIILTSVFALYGVIKDRPLFVLPFILCSIFITFLLAVVEVAVSSTQFLTCTIAYLIIHSEIFIYFILVLYSHYRIIAGYVQEV